MALEKIPADIRVVGGVARMSDPKMIKQIMAAVTIPISLHCDYSWNKKKKERHEKENEREKEKTRKETKIKLWLCLSNGEV